MKKKYRHTPIHAIKLRIGNWQSHVKRIKNLLIERCHSDEPLKPKHLTEYNRQLEEINRKISYYQAKLNRALKAKARREAMQQLPPKEKS